MKNNVILKRNQERIDSEQKKKNDIDEIIDYIKSKCPENYRVQYGYTDEGYRIWLSSNNGTSNYIESKNLTLSNIDESIVKSLQRIIEIEVTGRW